MDDAADNKDADSLAGDKHSQRGSDAELSAAQDFTHDSLLTLAAALGEYTRYVGELLREGVLPQQILDGEPQALARLTASARERLPIPPDVHQRTAIQLRTALDDCGAEFLPITDARYPALLRAIPDPPPWLFCRGDISQLAHPQVAVVGARRASQAGLKIAADFGESLAQGGYRVCSGMALGIDGAAHRGALKAGSTIAVFGTSIDFCYPRRHHALAREIEQRGCLLSELPPGTPMHRAQFPRRNRIISGLSQATVIVEAALPSGSLHTAASALEQGRDVLVFPWSVLHRGGAGCLRLLRDGATPITSLDELEQHFPPQLPLPFPPSGERGTEHKRDELVNPSPVLPPADPKDAALLTLIGDGQLSLQVMQQSTGFATAELLARLGRLELAGYVVRDDGSYQLSFCKPCQDPGS